MPALAGWTVAYRNAVTLAPGSVTGISELSGIAYAGPGEGALERFLAVQDSGNQVVSFNVGFAADGSISSAIATDGFTLSPGFDLEGIVISPTGAGKVFVSEESTPGVREYDLATGNLLQSVTLPDVWDEVRSNLALEGLARLPDGRRMWTVNEEALSIDGPRATTTDGTTVRLQRLDVAGDTVSAGPQFAYEVEPIHATSPINNQQRGASDLAMLPDGSLLVLERSFSALASPSTYHRAIYEIELTGATDVSAPQFDDGLEGASFTPVGKQLLWEDPVAGASGQNLEGLTLGPRLASGNWVLLGVVDDSGGADPFSDNTIVSFEVSLTECSLAGDYNCSGVVDPADHELWRFTYGDAAMPVADGSGDGMTGILDYVAWRDRLGEVLGTAASAGTVSEPAHLPEPGTAAMAVLSLLAGLLRRLPRVRRRHLGNDP